MTAPIESEKITFRLVLTDSFAGRDTGDIIIDTKKVGGVKLTCLVFSKAWLFWKQAFGGVGAGVFSSGGIGRSHIHSYLTK